MSCLARFFEPKTRADKAPSAASAATATASAMPRSQPAGWVLDPESAHTSAAPSLSRLTLLWVPGGYLVVDIAPELPYFGTFLSLQWPRSAAAVDVPFKVLLPSRGVDMCASGNDYLGLNLTAYPLVRGLVLAPSASVVPEPGRRWCPVWVRRWVRAAGQCGGGRPL